MDIEKVPASVKRCPNCKSLSLEFDPVKGKLRCMKCGFEQDIMSL